MTKHSQLPPRERILRTAHELFYQVGIRATGIDRIIAQAQVTKVTFYRHFPSKNELVTAVLQYRHDIWLAWFVDALDRYRSQGINSVVSALAEWFQDNSYRGCAFINAVVEVGDSIPEVVQLSRQHKSEMARAIAKQLPASRSRQRKAEVIAMAVDGAIIRAQMGERAQETLSVFKHLLTII